MRVGARRAQLFDLESDPGERVDLAAKRPELVRELRRGLEVLLREGDAAAQETPGVSLDEETRQKLIALGYVE